MTDDIERAARVIVDPDLIDRAFHIYARASELDEEEASRLGFATAAFAGWSGRAPASAEDHALVRAVELRLAAFDRLIEAGEGPRLGGRADEAWRRAAAAAVASAELIEVDGDPAFRIDDLLDRIRSRPMQ